VRVGDAVLAGVEVNDDLFQRPLDEILPRDQLQMVRAACLYNFGDSVAKLLHFGASKDDLHRLLDEAAGGYQSYVDKIETSTQ
jgi:hypothetical protein